MGVELGVFSVRGGIWEIMMEMTTRISLWMMCWNWIPQREERMVSTEKQPWECANQALPMSTGGKRSWKDCVLRDTEQNMSWKSSMCFGNLWSWRSFFLSPWIWPLWDKAFKTEDFAWPHCVVDDQESMVMCLSSHLLLSLGSQFSGGMKHVLRNLMWKKKTASTWTGRRLWFVLLDSVSEYLSEEKLCSGTTFWLFLESI